MKIPFKLERYAALSAFFVGSQLSGQAAVVYTNIDPDALVGFPGSYDVDLDNDGSPEFVIDGYANAIPFGVQKAITVYGLEGSLGFVTSNPLYGGNIAALDAGMLIDSAAPIRTAGAARAAFCLTYAPFGSGTPIVTNIYGEILGAGEKFFGFAFDIAGNQHYGWVRLQVANDFSGMRIIDYAYEDVPGLGIMTGAGDTTTCSTALPPQNLQYIEGPVDHILSWDPVSGSVACQAMATRIGPAGSTKTANVVSTAPASVKLSKTAVSPGTTWEWKVRCACSLDPILGTPFSATDTFTIPVPRIAASTPSALFPNPAAEQTTLTMEGPAARDTEVRIVDLNGRVVDFLVLPEAARNLRLNLSALPNGMYFVQVGDLEAVPLEVRH